jgi:hypothetical protein
METRIQLLVLIVFVGVMMAQFGLRAQYSVEGAATRGGLLVVVLLSIMLPGAGIATQTGFQANKGLHESTFFTLSLPVSRFRLLAVRSGLGWLEMAGVIAVMCCLFWVLFPAVQATITPEEMFKQAIALTACATGLYSMNVLLTTFLDNPWRAPGVVVAFVALSLLFNHTPVPASVNIFRAMGEGSPLIAHTMPWPAMAFSLGLAAILFFAALKVVQRREY